MIEEKNKKIIIPAIVLILIVAGFFIYRNFQIVPKEKSSKPQEYDAERVRIEAQYQELTRLRKEAGNQLLTPEEINLQMQELDYLRKLAK